MVYGFGEIPMMLIMNLDSDDKKICVTVCKVYLMRYSILDFLGKLNYTEINFQNSHDEICILCRGAPLSERSSDQLRLMHVCARFMG